MVRTFRKHKPGCGIADLTYGTLWLAVFTVAAATVFGQSETASGNARADDRAKNGRQEPTGESTSSEEASDSPAGDAYDPFGGGGLSENGGDPFRGGDPFGSSHEKPAGRPAKLWGIFDPEASTETLYEQGMELLAEGDHQKALKFLETALEREASPEHFIGRSKALCMDRRSCAGSYHVKAALEWLAGRQGPGGAWDLDSIADCHRRSANGGGRQKCRQRATSLALLCFLGCGQTHQVGQYPELVESGLYFLASQMELAEAGVDARGPGGDMTDHALATLVICEAYSMSGDKQLKDTAQRLLNFIVSNQNRKSDGWGLRPRGNDDLDTTGWTVLALASGHRAKLKVPRKTFDRLNRYFDSLQSGEGAFYGSLGPGREPRATAIGLLYRMLSGTPATDPAIQRGVRYLTQWGRAKYDPEHNFFATCFMREAGLEGWKDWNGSQRDLLTETQVCDGSNAGSWFTPSPRDVRRRSRFEQTTLNALCLIVYYRHLPIWRKGTRIGRSSSAD